MLPSLITLLIQVLYNVGNTVVVNLIREQSM